MDISGATHSTLPKNLHNSQGFKDIHGDIYAWRYIWEYVLEERVSEAPPAVVRRICGYVGCVCVFITSGPITKPVCGGGGGEWRTCAMRDDEPRRVWMSPLITH